VRDKGAYDTLKPMDISRWQHELREVIRDPQELLAKTSVMAETGQGPGTATATFPLKVPHSYVQRMRPGQADDPLLRQIMPLAEEDKDHPGYTTDPLGEIGRTSTPGLIHKYHGRVLLVTTSVCAIHCRYCFRRHYPYTDNNPAQENWSAALDYIHRDPTIHEVILSGGDPLSLADHKLQSLISKLEQIPHLRWLRIHTRMPIVMPSRVTGSLLQALTNNRFRQTMVIHANHPHEIEADVIPALQQLHSSGIQLLNQSVLLKGVNDDALVLRELSQRLYTHRVLPYYLHLLDPVAGAAHFEVDETSVTVIMETLRSTLPGYLVPRLVRETAGAPYKTVVG